MRMPSKKQYNLVINDELDSRIPLHNDEAFAAGIKFGAKYIGTLDVPRPTSKIEIVAAMRRIRYEFKARSIKKKKVTMEVSVEGVRVLLRKKKKKVVPPVGSEEESRLLIMSHPIYRIFYVSHDSQDLKIFSYIARDASSNVFRCSVFKAHKKSQAMRIVRTVGQAFEVCHKFSSVKDSSPRHPSPPPSECNDSDDSDDKRRREDPDHESSQEDQMTLTSDSVCDESIASGVRVTTDLLTASPTQERTLKKKSSSSKAKATRKPTSIDDESMGSSSPAATLALNHELQMVKEQLGNQEQQTQAAVAQVHLLRDQLAAETAARLEAQARTHQLLVHNKELLEHIQALVLQIKDLEKKPSASPSRYVTPPAPALPTDNPPSGPIQSSPRLLQHHLQHQIFQQQLQQQLQHHQQQQQQIQQQMQHSQQQFLQQKHFPQSSSSSEQSSRESVTASIAALFPTDPCGNGAQSSPSYHQQNPSFFPSTPTSRRLPLVPEDAALASLLPPSAFQNLSNLSPYTSCSGGGDFRVPEGCVPGPITRTVSERMPRQNTLAQLQRMSWARHTTK